MTQTSRRIEGCIYAFSGATGACLITSQWVLAGGYFAFAVVLSFVNAALAEG